MDRHTEHNLTGQPGYGWGMTDKPFLTIGEVADILQVSNRTVYNLIYKGTLRACRLTYHITIITKEDFFLMIKETTYCKRSVSVFAKQGKKTKEEDERETKQKTEKAELSRQEGKKKTKSAPKKRQLIPATNYKQSVRDTFTDKESAGSDLYTMAEICQKFNYTYGRLQPPYALLDTLHQSQCHQVFPEIGSGQGYGRGSGTTGKQPVGALVFLFRHHAPVRSWQNPSPQVRPHSRSKDETHTRQSPVLP